MRPAPTRLALLALVSGAALAAACSKGDQPRGDSALAASAESLSIGRAAADTDSASAATAPGSATGDATGSAGTRNDTATRTARPAPRTPVPATADSGRRGPRPAPTKAPGGYKYVRDKVPPESLRAGPPPRP